MPSFQFDENFNAKKVIERCNDEGHCIAHRFPQSMAGRGCKDPEVLKTLMVGESPIITFDREIVEEHGEHIPDDNPGLIIVRLRGAVKTMTAKIGADILHTGLKIIILTGGLKIFVVLRLISQKQKCKYRQ